MNVINIIADKTGLPKQKVLSYSLGFMVAFVIFGVGASIITNIVGVAYPVFMSFKALDSEGIDDDQMWLTYWIVFGGFNILDQIAGFILGLIPFYYVLKLGFLIWCFHPATTGSLVLYKSFILPFYEEHEAKLKEFEDKAKSSVGKATEFVKDKAEDLADAAKDIAQAKKDD